MRKMIILALAALLAIGLISMALAGCGTSTTAVKTPSGQTSDNSSKGETTGTVRTPTEAELGVPVYPNAKMDENAMLTSTDAQGKKSVIAASLWTPDSTDKVIAWYKDQLAGKSELKEMPVVEGGKNEMVFAWKEGDKYKMVTVGADKGDHPGDTGIGVGAGPGSAPAGGSSQ
jgi:hypothetical protein